MVDKHILDNSLKQLELLVAMLRLQICIPYGVERKKFGGL